MIANLGPDGSEVLLGPLAVFRGGGIVFIVMVGVDDDVEPGFQGVIHHRVHPVQEGFVNGVFRCRRRMLSPGDGNADGFKAQLLDIINELLGGHGVSPGGFSPGGIEGVAQIPAKLHFRRKFQGGHGVF